MSRSPSLHALRAFEAAARVSSFARASEELHLSPSAVSHQVRALEQHFGRPLFVRANRQVSLTPDGERLFVVLTQAFSSIHGICAELSPPEQAQGLSVHCTPSFAAKWLGPRLPSFIAQHPEIHIRLSSNAEPFDLMRHEGIDIAIAYGTAPHRPGLTTQSLGQEELVALCSPEFAQSNDSTDASILEKVICLDSSFSPVRWPDWFALNGLPLPTSRNGPSFDRGSLVVAAAVQGLGVALETLRFAQAEVDDGSLVRFGGDSVRSIKRDLHFLCYRTRDQDSAKVQKFRQWILARIAGGEHFAL